MRVLRDVMNRDLVMVDPSATLAEAATIMGERGVGSALVLEDGALAGIFTERDLVRALGTHFDAAGHAVSQWMTRDPVTIGADAAVGEARDLMLVRGFRHLPVMEGGALVGVVSIRDLARTAE